MSSPRGRPRSERARLAVLDAAADLLIEGGMAAATMEAIAARAGVSKATIYKWWPSRGHVALDSFFTRTKPTMAVEAGATLEDTLIAQVGALAGLLRDPATASLMRETVAVAQTDPDIRSALDTRWLRPRRAAVEGVLRDAAERGEIRADVDFAAAMDQLFGPLYYRLLFRHEPLDERLAETLVRQMLAGLSP
ncbi:TetR/AcrR family transcriptional regulator [Amycolatopsis sp.]|uniref:TetR/AcrR family transcriptional regulator n=1 Tax=Amycolatopsis sp. TaxID=37632 RepID=UPI002DFEAA00|nr:TetR/AcrR family transcriptional regulator C-terminal ligand-binding domain-containing protein [Amycolatopsis sp.]